MSLSKLPETDLARIARYCKGCVPIEHQDQIRVEYRTRGKTVTIVECRPAWPGEGGLGWSDNPQARIKYDETTAAWTLYWFDRNSRSHYYDLLDQHQPIQRILDEIERDPTCIFWG
jgi:hypothetical protein